MLAQLGADGTQRYTPAQDIIPAINGASRSFQAFMGGYVAEKKGSEEAFRDITRTVIYQTNAAGGIVLDGLPDTVWTVLALYAEPTTIQPAPTIIVLPDDESRYRGDLSFKKSSKKVKRITLEELAETELNMSMSGNERLASNAGLRTYAYYWTGDRNTSSGGNPWSEVGAELVVIPLSQTSKSLVGVTYLKSVPPITAIGDILPYPDSMFNLLRELALHELTPKQGDGTTLYGITEKDIARMLNIQS